ncbi:hypothetical protein BC829DRAFT_380897 [Chytridium lagenaria]|nr:hypothetical protein BC829DRAFT_380897 [Chytridium lagenaria]
MVIAKEINNAESMLGKEKAKWIEMKFPAPKQAVRCLEMLYDKELKMFFVEYYQDAIKVIFLHFLVLFRPCVFIIAFKLFWSYVLLCI